MIGLLRAESRKLFSTKIWIWLLLGACVLAGGSTALLIGFADQAAASPQGGGLAPIGTPEFTQVVLAGGANGTVFLLILGIIGMTQEYRHRTATPTFLVSPKRGMVVGAKAITYLLVSLVFGIIVSAVVLAVALPWLSAKGAPASLTGDNIEVLIGAVGASAIYGLVGVGVGALLRNQVAAIVGSLVYLFVVEPIVRSVEAIAPAYKFLPGGALEAITATFDSTDLLERWQGALLLLAYGIVFSVLGWLLSVRRDIT